MRLVGNVLPLVNVVLYFLVDRTGGPRARDRPGDVGGHHRVVVFVFVAIAYAVHGGGD